MAKIKFNGNLNLIVLQNDGTQKAVDFEKNQEIDSNKLRKEDLDYWSQISLGEGLNYITILDNNKEIEAELLDEKDTAFSFKTNLGEEPTENKTNLIKK